MKIFVLTPIYATTTSMQGATPVVHYFTREWVKMGHEVTVFQFLAKYPRLMYWVGRHFQHQLNTRLGMLVPVETPMEDDYVVDGVIVHCRCLKKMMPHSLYKKERLQQAIDMITDEIAHNGIPDWFVGHWDNPQLELLDALKKRYGKPTCLVLHSNGFDFEKKYEEKGLKMLGNLDVIGFRSLIAQQNFVIKYGVPKRSFIASSGVSEAFLLAGDEQPRLVQQPIRNFIFVGSLIARKYPTEIITALSHVYPKGNFTMTFIGDGDERAKIEEEYNKLGKIGVLKFTGRIPREEIIQYLKESDVFVMISKAEVFGLVYLEAMALGVIPVGSRNEGIDGVIRDGENGFLCKAGDVDELTSVLDRIKNMSNERIEQISLKAKETAQEFSDKGVAEKYINALSIWN